MTRILVTGSKSWTLERDRDMQRAGTLPPDEGLHHIMVNALMRAWIDLGKPARPVLVHGANGGADRMADGLWNRLWGWPTEPHPPDVELLGRKAEPLRNEKMIQLGADLVLGFPLGESRGTRGCMELARKAGIPVRAFGPDILWVKRTA